MQLPALLLERQLPPLSRSSSWIDSLAGERCLVEVCLASIELD